MELNHYYITDKGTIITSDYALDSENPLTRYGVVGAIDSDFNHIATTSITYSEALESYSHNRIIPIEIFTHSDSRFYECDENPCLFVILDESIADDATDLEKFKKLLLREFEAWYNGYVYDIIEYDLEMNLLNSWESFDDFESEIKANFTILENVTHLVNAWEQSETHKDEILAIIAAKAVRG